MTIAYSQYFEELTAIVAEADALVLRSAVSEADQLQDQLVNARSRVDRDATLRIAVIGEFSAGKTSLINALTGLSLKVDADVCTRETREYEWRGLILVDTPGVQAQVGETDHDKIAQQATIGADLVLFIITNELFNPRLAAHLRYILDEEGLGLSSKTAIIVNKVDRESNPEETLRGEIQRVVGPHQDIPIYFCSASSYKMASTVPTEMQQRFVEQSQIPALTHGIDQFVQDTEASGRLMTPLQVLASVLEGLQSSLAVSDDDKRQLELVRRQRAVLQSLQDRLLETRKTWKHRAFSTVLSRTDSVLKDISDTTTDDDLERLFQFGMAHAVAELDGLHHDVVADVSASIDEARAKLDEIGASPLGQEVRASSERAATVKVEFDAQRPGAKVFAAKVGKATVKPIQEGLDLASKNAQGLRDVVYKVGKQMGKKFRPHEAIKAGEKLARIAGRVSKAAPYLASALDFYIQHREENKKGEQARYLAQMRISMRNAFADQARVEADSLEASIDAVSQGPVSDALARLDAEQAEISARESQTTQVAREVASLMERCTRLRSDLVRSVPVGGITD
jgi:tRNA U34 5-carboxymethylaminomethyl modifying GTPase MnmE/TrmE